MPVSTDSLFVGLIPQANGGDDAARQAIECVEAFTARFNARDLAGMDGLLHFPHAILSGEKLIVWDHPGQHAATFFDELVATGWHRTTYRDKRTALATSSKVHLVVEYSRDDVAGNPLSVHHNVWIVTLEGSRWGIKLRSH